MDEHSDSTCGWREREARSRRSGRRLPPRAGARGDAVPTSARTLADGRETPSSSGSACVEAMPPEVGTLKLQFPSSTSSTYEHDRASNDLFSLELICWVIVYLVELISEFYFYDLSSHF